MDYYRDGIEAGYFRTAGSDKYLSGPFANKKVAMFVGSIAGAGFVQKMLKLVAMNTVLHHVLKKSTYNKEQIFICSIVLRQNNGQRHLNS